MKPTVAHNRRHTLTRGLALVDIENLAGTPKVSAELVKEINEIFYEMAQMDPLSHTYVACNPKAGFNVGYGWEHTHNLCLKGGKDGADLALLEQLNAIPNLDEFYYIVIGSGDHIFADVALELRRKGHFVHVIARKESIAPNLRRAANHVTHLN